MAVKRLKFIGDSKFNVQYGRHVASHIFWGGESKEQILDSCLGYYSYRKMIAIKMAFRVFFGGGEQIWGRQRSPCPHSYVTEKLTM